MKSLILTVSLLISAVGYCEVVLLPPVTLNQNALGGDVILINMKDHLIIKGHESRSLESELGLSQKKNFIQDLVMAKPLIQLMTSYNMLNMNPTVQMVLDRYAQITMQIESKTSLN